MGRFLSLCRVAVAGLGLAAMAGAAPAGAAEEPFRIGGIVALSGPYAIYGEGMRRGVEMAVAEKGSLLGRPIVVEWEDSQTKPETAVQQATKMIAGGADLLFGATASGATVAVMELAKRRKVPLLVTGSADDRITGADRNRYTFRTSNQVATEIGMISRYVADNDIKSVYAVVADVSVFRDAWAAMRAGFDASGVTVVGEDFPSWGSKDFSIIIDKAQQSGAQMIALLVGGGDAITFVKQADAVKLDANAQIVGPVIMDETLAKAAGDAALGTVSAVRYHFSLDTPANAAFVERFRAQYDDWPGFTAGEAYDGMRWLLSVIEQSGSTDPEVWIPVFETSVWDSSVEGRKAMRACDHQASQVNFLAKVVPGEPPYPAHRMAVIASWPDAELGLPDCQ
ncbi:MAG: ABC transporter substrate-binding protein [Sneathiellaceae bacterium]